MLLANIAIPQVFKQIVSKNFYTLPLDFAFADGKKPAAGKLSVQASGCSITTHIEAPTT
jgi:hypothetical protein